MGFWKNLFGFFKKHGIQCRPYGAYNGKDPKTGKIDVEGGIECSMPLPGDVKDEEREKK